MPLSQQIIDPGMSRVHLRPLDGVHDDRHGVRSAMGALGGGFQPIIVFCGHQHELAPAVARDFDWFLPRLMLEFPELALKLHGRRLGHSALPIA
jgi:hypothetical protein